MACGQSEVAMSSKTVADSQAETQQLRAQIQELQDKVTTQEAEAELRAATHTQEVHELLEGKARVQRVHQLPIRSID